MISESLRIRPRHGVDMKYDCGLSIAVVGCILIIVISLVTQPFWNCTMGTALREARWFERGLGGGDLCSGVREMSGSGALPG